jgi:hypothetical protein
MRVPLRKPRFVKGIECLIRRPGAMPIALTSDPDAPHHPTEDFRALAAQKEKARRISPRISRRALFFPVPSGACQS